MKNLIIQIPKELLSPAETAHYEGEIKLSRIEKGTDGYSFAEPVRWRADITNTGGALLVSGTAIADARTTCARCLGPADIHLEGEIEEYFLINPENLAAEDGEEVDYIELPDDKRIDMAPLIRAALLLELPVVPVCDEDCKGLCPVCGADLNIEECEHSGGKAKSIGKNNPFGVLADLDLN